jgi:hypothetical protein
MKTLITLATSTLIFPLTILPNSIENCADNTWQFATVSNTADYQVAAEVARGEYCRVVATNAAMWN